MMEDCFPATLAHSTFEYNGASGYYGEPCDALCIVFIALTLTLLWVALVLVWEQATPPSPPLALAARFTSSSARRRCFITPSGRIGFRRAATRPVLAALLLVS